MRAKTPQCYENNYSVYQQNQITLEILEITYNIKYTRSDCHKTVCLSNITAFISKHIFPFSFICIHVFLYTCIMK